MVWGTNTPDSHPGLHLLGFADAAALRSSHASSAGHARPRFLDPGLGARERRPSPRGQAPPPEGFTNSDTRPEQRLPRLASPIRPTPRRLRMLLSLVYFALSRLL